MPAGRPIYTQTDAYTVYLSRQGYVISTDKDGRIQTAVAVTTVVSAMRGTTAVTAVVGTLPSVAGCTLSKSGTTVTAVFNAGTSLAENGTVDIPVTVDGKPFTVSFAYAKAHQGAPDVDANLLDWVSDWDTGKTVIGSHSVITPKIFASVKNGNGTLTGVALGRFPLSTVNASGSVVTETIDGIYGFKDGYRTFSIDNGGNVQLGRGNQFIKFNAATGTVEFSSDVFLNWTAPVNSITTALGGSSYSKLTRIDANGIYTGTLTAAQVNAVSIDAGSITAGTLNAARIDAASLKATLITATNILNVTRGKIGGWTVDSDSIFKGTKNNTSGAYTSASGYITMGSGGIRGYRWRLDATGAGAVAGGNIAWDASGNVTFASSVSLKWESGIDTAKELAGAMAFGRMLYRDPTFYNGTNSMGVYNNSGNGTVTITRTTDSNAPNDSKIVLVIKNTGSSSPGCGGFYFSTSTAYKKILVTRIIAKIPAGRDISFHTNSMGAGGVQKWLTPVAGTGQWCEYICKVTCGTADFSNTNYFAVTGDTGTESAPVEWRIAYATVFDVTSSERYTTTIDANGIYTGTVRASQVVVDSALVVGGSSYNGSISVCDASNSVKVTLDRTGITAVGGTIGGWTIASNQISKNSVILSSDGSITNGTKWKLNNDGSGQFANGNISWTASGTVTVTGTINASAGTIDGFEIGSGRIGSTASGSGSGSGLAIYNDLFRVGSSTSYVLFGDDTFPATAGGAFTATGRVTNNKSNSGYTNCGIYINVTGGTKNFGVHSNAALMAPAHVSNKIKTIVFNGSSYSIDFSQNNLFFIYGTANYSVTLPTESSVASMFGLSALPSDFACVFTLIYNYNYSYRITINSVRNHDDNLVNFNMEKGDTLTLVCAKFPSFHYQILNYGYS